MPNPLPVKDRSRGFNLLDWIGDRLTRDSFRIWIEKFISVVIVIDLLLLGVNTFHIPEFLESVVTFLNIAIQVIFFLDCLRIILIKREGVFKDGWALSDCLITIITIIPIGEWSQYSRVIRSIRVIRCIRVFSHVEELKSLIRGQNQRRRWWAPSAARRAPRGRSSGQGSRVPSGCQECAVPWWGFSSLLCTLFYLVASSISSRRIFMPSWICSMLLLEKFRRKVLS